MQGLFETWNPETFRGSSTDFFGRGGGWRDLVEGMGLRLAVVFARFFLFWVERGVLFGCAYCLVGCGIDLALAWDGVCLSEWVRECESG